MVFSVPPGMSGLLSAVYAGELRLVRRLVEMEADVNRRARGLGESGLLVRNYRLQLPYSIQIYM